jgi:DNA-binding Lrp family transcriptional regulator
MEEIVWHPLKGYEDRYLITRCGKVKRLAYSIDCGGKKVGVRMHFPESMMTVNYNKLGYATVSIKVNNKNINKLLHRLLAIQFIPNPENKPEINHIDGDTGNFSLENLEWVTHSENGKHAYKYLERRKIVYTDDLRRKMSESHKGMKSTNWKGYYYIDNVQYESSREAAIALGITNTTIFRRIRSADWPTWTRSDLI